MPQQTTSIYGDLPGLPMPAPQLGDGQRRAGRR